MAPWSVRLAKQLWSVIGWVIKNLLSCFIPEVVEAFMKLLQDVHILKLFIRYKCYNIQVIYP
jgi:hypothetical protein